ncbi:MAG: hypothetical protein LUE25_06465 [Clostridiales bacterium]|nr:hypothetical protein [Clostridiales bacterium]
MTNKDIFDAIGGISDAHAAEFAAVRRVPIYRRSGMISAAAACLLLALLVGGGSLFTGLFEPGYDGDGEMQAVGDVDINWGIWESEYETFVSSETAIVQEYVIYVPTSDGYVTYTYTYNDTLDVGVGVILCRIVTLGELDGCTMSVDKAERTLVEETFSDDEDNSYVKATYIWNVELTGVGLDDDILKCVVNTLLDYQMSSSVILTVNGEPAVIDGVTCPDEGFGRFELEITDEYEAAE